MTKLSLLLAGVLGAVLLLTTSGASAQVPFITNGGFEAGTLLGWTATIPTDGSVDVLASCPTTTCPGSFAPYAPAEGGRFAVLKTDGPGSFTIVSQAVMLPAGATIYGVAFFADGEVATESFFCDNAAVRIIVATAPNVTSTTTVFTANSCATSASASTGWTPFQFVMPQAGNASIEARITNIGDSAVDSRMGLDGVTMVGTRPQVGSGFGAIVAGADGTRDNLARQAQAQGAAQQSAAAAAAAAQQATQPSAGLLRPPSTGDAGLIDRSAETPYGLIALLATVVALTLIAAGAVSGRRWAQSR
jgi:hypothetical protein